MKQPFPALQEAVEAKDEAMFAREPQSTISIDNPQSQSTIRNPSIINLQSAVRNLKVGV
jgi:hypothetical protein